MKNNLFGTALIGIFIGLIIVSIICKETEVVNKQDTAAVGSHNKSDTLDVTTDECMIVYRWYGKHKQWWHYQVEHIYTIKRLMEKDGE